MKIESQQPGFNEIARKPVVKRGNALDMATTAKSQIGDYIQGLVTAGKIDEAARVMKEHGIKHLSGSGHVKIAKRVDTTKKPSIKTTVKPGT